MAETVQFPLKRCMQLGVVEWPPFISSIRGQAPNYTVTGILMDVINVLAGQLKVCTQFIPVEDQTYGVRLPNGTWTGLMGVMTRKEADMSATVLSISAERAMAVSLSEPLFMDEQAVGYKMPVLESDVSGFVKPYQNKVWLLLTLTLVGVIGITFFVHYLFCSSFNQSTKNKELIDGQGVSNSIWISCLWTVGASLAQSTNWLPKGDSVRVITGLWLLMAFILGSVYRSNLKAMLILPKIRLPFNNIEELVESRIPTYIRRGSMIDQAIMTAPEGSIMKELRKQIVNNPPTSFDMLGRDLREGRLAMFLGKRAYAFYFHNTYTRFGCTMYLAKGTVFGGTSLSFAFPKGSPLKARVDYIIHGLKEAGILERLFSQGTSNASFCLRPNLNEPATVLRTLDLVDFFGVFSIYAVGIMISLIAFCMEVLTSGFRQRDHQKILQIQ